MSKYTCAAAAAFVLTTTGVVYSADIAKPVLKAPSLPAVTYNWTGVYVGAGWGYGMYNLDTEWFADGLPFTLPVTQRQGGRGWLATVTVGGDYQFTDRLVAGVFADYDLANIKGTLQNQSAFSVGDMKETDAWAVGARVGWLIDPELLAYVNGGYTKARFSDANMSLNEIHDPFFGSTVSNVPSHTYSGWFIGAGMETTVDGFRLLGPGWFWRNEYRYADYRSATLPDLCTSATACAGSIYVGISPGTNLSTVTIHPVVQTVRSELLYKFGVGDGRRPTAAARAPVSVNWTGLYVGGGLDYGMYNIDASFAGAFDPFSMPQEVRQGGRGWLGTITAGADYQFTKRIVAGVFGDFDWANIKGTLPYQVPFESGEMKESRAWAVGLRVGWLVDPAILTYFNGGYTQARFDETHLAIINSGSSFFGAAPDTISGHTYSGWFLGSGIEAGLESLGPFGRGWFWRNEYRYANYGRATLPIVCTDPVVCPVPPIVIPVGSTVSNVTAHPTVQTFRTALVYKFNWDGQRTTH